MSKLPRYLQITLFIFGSEAAGLIGSIFTFQAIPTWYVTLTKPTFTPPSWLFGPVWTILYALMGIAAYLVWSKGFNKKTVRSALQIFIIQLILNALWSILFFGLKQPAIAFGEIGILWLVIIANIKRFYDVDKKAGIILIPYLAWVSFASLLNFAIVILN